MTPEATPGWYPDPRGGDGHRYWTGESWAPDGAAVPPQQAAHPWAPGGSGSPPSFGTSGSAPDFGTSYLSSYGNGYADEYAPLSGGPEETVGWRRTATWVALIAGILAGFGGGYGFAQSRADSDTALPVVTSTATPSPRPSPSTPKSAPAPVTPSPRSSPFGTPSPGAPAPNPSESVVPEDVLPPPPEDPDAGLLDAIGLRRSDIESSVRVGLIGGGDEVVGQTTLDLCRGEYASERRRTARRQLAAVISDDSTVMMTEAVLYDAPASVEAAFGELDEASKNCELTAGIDKDWPQVDGVTRLAYEQFIGAGEARFKSTAVYLRSGRTLLALYFRDPGVTRTPVAGKSTIKDVTAVFAARLANMPSTAGAVA